MQLEFPLQPEFPFENIVGADLAAFLSVEQCSPEEKWIGFESPGHYTYNLKRCLDKSDFFIWYMELNPVLFKKFICGRPLHRMKMAQIDTKWIAAYLTTVESKPHPMSYTTFPV